TSSALSSTIRIRKSLAPACTGWKPWTASSLPASATRAWRRASSSAALVSSSAATAYSTSTVAPRASNPEVSARPSAGSDAQPESHRQSKAGTIPAFIRKCMFSPYKTTLMSPARPPAPRCRHPCPTCAGLEGPAGGTASPRSLRRRRPYFPVLPAPAQADAAVEPVAASAEVGSCPEEQLRVAGHQGQRRLGTAVVVVRGIDRRMALAVQPQHAAVVALALVHRVHAQARHQGRAADLAAAAEAHAHPGLQAGGRVELRLHQRRLEVIHAGADPAGAGHRLQPQALAEAQAGIDAGAVGRAFDAAAKLGLAGTQLALEVVELGQAVDEEAAADMAAIDAEVGAVQVVAAAAVA